jgi:hypothetical protein
MTKSTVVADPLSPPLQIRCRRRPKTGSRAAQDKTKTRNFFLCLRLYGYNDHDNLDHDS